MSLHGDRFEVPPGQTHAKAWRSFIRAIARRRAAAHWRAIGRLRAGDRVAAPRAQELVPSAEDMLILHAPLRTLHTAVDALKDARPSLHAVLAMHLDGAPMAKIAAALRIPEKSAWNRLRLARRALREIVERWAKEDAGCWMRAIFTGRRC